MTLDEVLNSLFPKGHSIVRHGGLLIGHAELAGARVDVIGVTDRLPFGIDEALTLASQVLDTVARGGDTPIVVLVDSDSQRMSKRDELLGLNEGLSHLAKCLMHADLAGHRTIGVLYGHTAAGAFIATALATRTLLAVPGAEPEVMDLPSMSRVTKLPIDVLKEMSRSTPVFAPGLDNLVKMGAVDAVLDPARALDAQVGEWLGKPADRIDRRASRGRYRPTERPGGAVYRRRFPDFHISTIIELWKSTKPLPPSRRSRMNPGSRSFARSCRPGHKVCRPAGSPRCSTCRRPRCPFI